MNKHERKIVRIAREAQEVLDKVRAGEWESRWTPKRYAIGSQDAIESYNEDTVGRILRGRRYWAGNAPTADGVNRGLQAFTESDEHDLDGG